MTSSTRFAPSKGKSDLNPVPPADEENSLTLYRLIVPPYTHNVNDVEFEGVSHKRYTMTDIGEVDKRLERVELLVLYLVLKVKLMLSPT